MNHFTMLYEYGKCTLGFLGCFHFSLVFFFSLVVFFSLAFFGGGGGILNETVSPLHLLDMR